MDTYSSIALVVFILSLLGLFTLSKLFRYLIRKQIDEKMKEIIPLKAIRSRIGVKIKMKK